MSASSSPAWCHNLLLAVPLSLAAYVAYHFVPWRVHAAIATWPLWLRALAAFVVGDLGFYWGHRWMHEIPFLWRFHALHHNPEHVYFLISARAHPIDSAFIRLCGLVPIYMLGLGAPQSVRGTLIAMLVMLAVHGLGLLHPCQRALAPRPTGMADRNPRLPPLAPHPLGVSGSQFRVDAAMHGPDLRHVSPAAKEWPSAYGVDTALPDSLAGQLLYPLRDPPEPQVLPQPANVSPG